MALTVRDLTVEIGGKLIVRNVSFEVRAGDKVGLVGRNGAGKTTLFRVLGGAAPQRAGSILRSELTGYLSQDPRSDNVPLDTSCLARVLSAQGLDQVAVELEALQAAVTEDPSQENVELFGEAQERFENLGGYAAEAEVRRLIAGLGLGADRLDLTVGALSGGERRRLELARILFAGSELLLLDEPTNHLDADARDWLLRFLRNYGGALVVVSHDLGLLDEAITRVMHLDREGEEAAGKLVEYRGTYSQYLVTRDLDEQRLGKLADRQDKAIKKLSTQADSMRGQTAKRARVAKNLDLRVQRIEAAKVDAPKKRRTMSMRLPDPLPCGRTVLEAQGLWKSYGTVDVFEDVTFDVGRGERILIMGLNGAGKTTLLKILAGRLAADLGEVSLGLKVCAGYFAQEHEGIVAGRNLLEHLREASPLGDDSLRALMGMFGLGGNKAFQDAASLSGGEKTKLALAQLVAGSHNLLLLDEPTNNLDPMSRTAVGKALANWAGTMVIVSHDPEFVRALDPDRVLTLPDGMIDYAREDHLDLVALA